MTLFCALSSVISVGMIVAPTEPSQVTAGSIGLPFLVIAGLYAGWETIHALPRLIIDDEGVGHRLIGSRAEKFSWGDIIEAETICERGMSFEKRRAIFMNVNNDGKYYKGKIFSNLNRKPVLTIRIGLTMTKLNDEQVREIGEVINSRARGKKPDQ